MLTRVTRLRLGHGIDNQDVLAISALAGIGFTVSLLIAGLAFTEATTTDHARAAVLLGTLIAIVLGAVLLRLRVRTQRRGPGANNHGSADLGRPVRGTLANDVRRRGARARRRRRRS